MKNTLLIAFLIIIAQFTGCSRKPETNQTQTPGASSDTVEAIEATIALSIPPDMRGQLSGRLQALLKKFDAEMVTGTMSADTEVHNFSGGGGVELKDDWSVPCSFTADKIPPVKFRKGEIGLFKGNVMVREGTEALVNDRAYVFTNGKWTALAEQK